MNTAFVSKWSRFAPLALILATFSWGSSFIALKHAVSVFNPIQVVFARMFVAAICFLAIYRLWRKQKYVAGDWKYFLLMSLGEPCLYFIFEAHALKYTTASSAGVINSLMPPLVAVGAWLFLRERVGIFNVAGLAVSIVGAVLLSLSSTETAYAPNPMLGNLLEFGAMASSSLYVIILRKISARYSALFLTALQAFIGTLFFAPLAIAQPLPQAWSTSGLLAVCYLGVFVTLGGYFLYNWGVANMSATAATVYVNLVPVFAILLAYLILNERFTPFQIVAALIIVGGVILSQVRSGKSAADATTSVNTPIVATEPGAHQPLAP